MPIAEAIEPANHVPDPVNEVCASLALVFLRSGIDLIKFFMGLGRVELATSRGSRDGSRGFRTESKAHVMRAFPLGTQSAHRVAGAVE